MSNDTDDHEPSQPAADANPAPDAARILMTSPGFAEWLGEISAGLAFTTYQAGRLFLVGLGRGGGVAANERLFERCQGMWTNGETLWLSSTYQLWQLRNIVPPGQIRADGADRMLVPRVGYVTGAIDVHDIGMGADGRPIFVNTRYGCLATVSEQASFVPLWKPAFLSALVPEDRCHLNGLAMRDGRACFVTAISRSDVADGWRDRRQDGGVVIDVESNEIVASGLSMPHSPRLHGEQLWVLNSGTGELGVIDLDNGKFEPAVFCPGYLRGLAFVGHYAVVGLSKARDSQPFAGLELQQRLDAKDTPERCGLTVVDLRSGVATEWLRFERTVTELYDVGVLPGARRPVAVGFKDPKEIAGAVTMGNPPPGVDLS